MEEELITLFDDSIVDDTWCFKNVRSVEQWTHGYHRYPAKFLPNVVQKLIEDFTNEGEVIADMFAGCGTTLVEAKIHGKSSIGVDINPVATLITRVKITPINPEKLSASFEDLCSRFSIYDQSRYTNLNVNERIDYWFTPENKSKIAFLYNEIFQIEEIALQEFFLVSLSHILKNCSRWLQSSTKPQVDKNKTVIDPFIAFISHSKRMIKKNAEFYATLVKKDFLNISCNIRLEDARHTSILSESIGTIITSPPYVTSYEYADIHQLTGFWFKYFENLREFRKDFIGTFYSQNSELKCDSKIAKNIISELSKLDDRTAKEVANYFRDMHAVAKEMYRILQINGHACIVIGNTNYRNVLLKSSEVFAELLTLEGFEISQVIKRSIPYKLIPTIRDKTTGRFAKLDAANSKEVYPEEYIIIAKKINNGNNK